MVCDEGKERHAMQFTEIEADVMSSIVPVRFTISNWLMSDPLRLPPLMMVSGAVAAAADEVPRLYAPF